MLIVAGIAALAVEIPQIQSHAEATGQTFWEAAVDPNLYLDQAAMVDAAVKGAMVVPAVVAGGEILLAGGGDVLQQGGMWTGNSALWNTGTSWQNAAVDWGAYWLTGEVPQPSISQERIFGDPVEFEGMKVYPRNDIDWEMTDGMGRTNLQRTQLSPPRAPLGADGKPITMHHIGQQPGVAAEVTNSVHEKGYNILHQNTGQYPSLIDRPSFQTWVNHWWRFRGDQIIQGE